jgi:hypothetical protein
MRDLINPKWMYVKAVLLLVGGALSGFLILLESPSLQNALLLCIAIGCFARAYYFAFYVMQRYVDPAFRFSGIGAFVVYLLRKRRSD